MNINKVNFGNVNNVYKINKQDTKQETLQQSAQKNTKDIVEISDLGKYLNKVNTGREEINMDKVNDIKRRIENGTYKVDSKDLAKKIIQHMKGEI
ncbi:flagellar biosynthesis anti-sigma factor FlgM [Romboutsia lituseburensis]|uniref:flagellar biosynthesis anti-sigma factor FlgM n=1 Tax=Romboutsia lituseburensis TaxID=1537 RepID=UPI00215A51F1|nr:flagellar biosynthesis anti-sigma factor FlgM [Romboutsia lituseburensis]MCR8746686.1 flagellar biosynthesis anti-sigma factor FlgM [Romboutsia lituseburensis]